MLNNKNINEQILNIIGEENFDQYMLLTKGKEISSILNSSNPVYKMYEYRHKLLTEGIGQDVKSGKLKQLLKDNNDIKLKKSLEIIFLDYLTDSKFKIVKNILDKHIGEWNVDRLLEIHKKYKYYRIFRLLNTNYKNWLS